MRDFQRLFDKYGGLNPDKQRVLYERHPRLLAPFGDGEPGCPLDARGIECGDGWHAILDSLLVVLERHLDDERRRAMQQGEPIAWVECFRALQIKEKFGTLRVYTCSGDDWINGAIELAGELSAHTCEHCGTTEGAEAVGKAHVQTLCPRCHRRRERELQRAADRASRAWASDLMRRVSR